VNEVNVPVTLPIQYRSEADIFSGEKRHEIHVVPKFAVALTPDTVVVPHTPPTAREVRGSVTKQSRGAAPAQV
jgi:hypothetical protein